MDNAELNALAERVERRAAGFAEASDTLAYVRDALAKDRQFNAFDSAENEEDDPDEDCEMLVCVGPITDARLICYVTGRAKANMIADALTMAAALRALTKEGRE